MKSFKDQKVNILFPISGQGQRFIDAGFDTPKPLIKVLDKLMIEWAVKSCNFLDKLDDYNLIFTVRLEHIEKYQIDKKLKDLFGSETIIIPIEVDKWPKGQAGHALAAKNYIDNDQPLFIYSCDTYSQTPIEEMIDDEKPDGVLSCFESNEERLSYAKLDKNGYVCETAEKKPISNLASNGHYYFRHGSDFVLATEEAIKKRQTFNGEYYIAPVYNFLIGLGRKIKVVMVTKNWEMGTSVDLESFITHYPLDK